MAQGAAVAALALALAFGSASPALAARSGGRVGGSSFSSARSYSSAGSSARSYSSAGSSSRSFGSGSSYSSRSSSAPSLSSRSSSSPVSKSSSSARSSSSISRSSAPPVGKPSSAARALFSPSVSKPSSAVRSSPSTATLSAPSVSKPSFVAGSSSSSSMLSAPVSKPSIAAPRTPTISAPPVSIVAPQRPTVSAPSISKSSTAVARTPSASAPSVTRSSSASRSSSRTSGSSSRRSRSVEAYGSGSSGAPAVAFSWGMMPFGGYGYGGGYGGGLAPSYGGGGGLNIGSLLLFGIVAYFAVSALQSYFNNSSDTDSYVGERVTVAKLQVGLLGSARTLQKQLDRIASRADTNSPSGLHYILQETVLQLVRNPEYVQYGASVVSNQRDLDRGEAKFNELSLEERSKFKEETLVNVGGRSRRQRYSRGAGGTGIPEYIVVTILVAASGKLDLPKVSSQDQLVKALNRLAAVREDQVMAVEVLWTPEDEDDTYSRDEMLLDYPVLNNL